MKTPQLTKIVEFVEKNIPDNDLALEFYELLQEYIRELNRRANHEINQKRNHAIRKVNKHFSKRH